MLTNAQNNTTAEQELNHMLNCLQELRCYAQLVAAKQNRSDTFIEACKHVEYATDETINHLLDVRDTVNLKSEIAEFAQTILDKYGYDLKITGRKIRDQESEQAQPSPDDNNPSNDIDYEKACKFLQAVFGKDDPANEN